MQILLFCPSVAKYVNYRTTFTCKKPRCRSQYCGEPCRSSGQGCTRVSVSVTGTDGLSGCNGPGNKVWNTDPMFLE